MSTARKDQLVEFAKQTFTKRSDEFFITPALDMDALKQNEKWLSKASPTFTSDDIVCGVLEKGLLKRGNYGVVFTTKGVYSKSGTAFSLSSKAVFAPYSGALVKLTPYGSGCRGAISLLLSLFIDAMKDVKVNDIVIRTSAMSKEIAPEFVAFLTKANETEQF